VSWEAIVNRDNALAVLRSVVESPSDYARDWKQRTKRPVIGTFCSYVPEELILAGDALPYRILPATSEFGRADTCLQTYACCLARSALELTLANRLDFLDGVLFGNTCDTMQCLADVWSVHPGGRPFDVFMMPVHVSHPAAREFTIAELRRLIDSMKSNMGLTIDSASLGQAIAACRSARQALAGLYELQRGEAPLLSPSQLYDVGIARAFMPPSDYAEALQAITNDPKPVHTNGPRIIIAGGPLLDRALPEVLEDLGASLAGDDLCTGCRAAWAGSGSLDDPMAALADRLLTRPPCPAKHAAGYDPGQTVVDRARQTGAQGVILYRLKFCDPHGFDYPRIKEALDEIGIPHILIEVETTGGSTGQLRTRLQAFLEMLAGARKAEANA
jgi:benzoyl-CoA reductase/2-hydroxyglutaryl-CoA dehydratase subunit BcrC/BadD/HgdB